MTGTQYQGSRFFIYVLAIIALLCAAMTPVHAETTWLDETKVKASLMEVSKDTYELTVSSPKPDLEKIKRVYVVLGTEKYIMNREAKKYTYFNKGITLTGTLPATVKIQVERTGYATKVSDEITLNLMPVLVDKSTVKVKKSPFVEGYYFYKITGSLKSDKVKTIETKIDSKKSTLTFNQDGIDTIILAEDEENVHFTITDEAGQVQEFDVAPTN